MSQIVFYLLKNDARTTEKNKCSSKNIHESVIESNIKSYTADSRKKGKLELVIDNLNINSFGHFKAILKHKINILALVKTKLYSILFNNLFPIEDF